MNFTDKDHPQSRYSKNDPCGLYAFRVLGVLSLTILLFVVTYSVLPAVKETTRKSNL